MIRVLCAPNALKGSVDALAAARCIAEGVRRATTDAAVTELPIADGGDGTRAVLCAALGGVTHELVVEDALGRSVRGAFSVIDGGRTGLIDVATASGLGSLAREERDALDASSFGTGQLVRAALDAGCRRIVLGVGGSASVDGGAGLLAALGVRLEDAAGAPIARGGAGLARLSKVDLAERHPALNETEIVIACDVTSPLLGPEGAARRYGPQKGATAEQVELLEGCLTHYAEVLEQTCGVTVADRLSGGAAGGIAAGLHAVLGAQLVSGIELVLDTIQFDARLAQTDLVITAEGQLDAQSMSNKGPWGVATRAARVNVPTVVLAGSVASDIPSEAFTRFAAALSIVRGPVSLDEAMQRGSEYLAAAAEQVTRLFLAARRR